MKKLLGLVFLFMLLLGVFTAANAGTVCQYCNTQLSTPEEMDANKCTYYCGVCCFNTTISHTDSANLSYYTKDDNKATGHYKKCSACGYELGYETHTVVNHEAKAATCTEIGWDAYVTCSVCDYTTYAEISATGHTNGEAVKENEVAATCTAAGSYDEVVYCTVCSDELSRDKKTIPAKGHTEEVIPGVLRTCTAPGLTDGLKCSVCEVILKEREKTEAIGHNWGSWKITTEPTATEAGEQARTCARCGEKETLAVPMLEMSDTGDTEEASGKYSIVGDAVFAPMEYTETKLDAVDTIIADVDGRVIRNLTISLDLLAALKAEGIETVVFVVDNISVTFSLDIFDAEAVKLTDDGSDDALLGYIVKIDPTAVDAYGKIVPECTIWARSETLEEITDKVEFVFTVAE